MQQNDSRPDRPVAERRQRLPAARLERFAETRIGLHHAHAATAPTSRGLQHHGVVQPSDRRDGRRGIVRGGERRGAARHDGHPHFDCKRAGCDLVTEKRQGRGWRADESDVVGSALRGELGVLRNKAVAWVHAVCPGAQRNLDQRGHIQVRGDWVGGSGVANLDGLRGCRAVERQRVGRGVDAHGVNAQPCGRSGDALRMSTPE